MDILIWDCEQKHADKLEEYCFKYLLQQNIEAEIILARSAEEVQQSIKESELLGIFLLSVDEKLEQITGEIRKSGNQSYIVLMSESVQNLFQHINPLTRPAGCLTKPVSERELREILQSIRKDYLSFRDEKDTFYFQINSTSYAVPCTQILFFESSGKKIVLRTISQEFEFYDSMGKIEQVLPDYFMRIHKSYIVNLNKIRKIDYSSKEVLLEDDMFVYVSRSYKSKLQNRISGGK